MIAPREVADGLCLGSHRVQAYTLSGCSELGLIRLVELDSDSSGAAYGG